MLEAFPALEYIASTARHIIEPTRHAPAARIDGHNDHAQTATALIAPVIDRIGTGDAFAAGILDALFARATLATTAQNGLAAAALAHDMRGDFTPLSRALLKGASLTVSDVTH